ncbi:MAG TPA: response regulator transcription factor [Gemmatimonadaceae bacterium]
MVPRGVGSLTTRVAVAAESAVERAGLVALLAGSPAVTLVHATENVRDVEALTSAYDVDVVVIALRAPSDLALPLELTPDLAHSAPAVVILVDNAAIGWIAEAYARGVYAVFPHDVNADELHGAVQSAGAGLVTLTRENYAALGVGARVTRTSASAAVEALTPRETEILGMLADGLANKEIAVRLNISSHTVKSHVQSLFSKLGADTRAEAVAVGVRRGLILL